MHNLQAHLQQAINYFLVKIFSLVTDDNELVMIIFAYFINAIKGINFHSNRYVILISVNLHIEWKRNDRSLFRQIALVTLQSDGLNYGPLVGVFVFVVVAHICKVANSFV